MWFGFGVRAVRVPGKGRRAGGGVVPASGEPGHGSWYFSLDLPRHIDGGRRRLRRAGFLTCDAAAEARERLSARLCGGLAVAGWLEAWAETRARLRDSTLLIYRGHIRVHLRRVLDGVLLAELAAAHVERAFRRLFDEGMSPVTARRVFSTLRTGLNAAVREGLIADSPARYVRLPRGARPHAVVWTPRRVQEWERTGIRPAGRGLGPGAVRRVPGLGRGPPAVPGVPPGRAARAAAR